MNASVPSREGRSVVGALVFFSLLTFLVSALFDYPIFGKEPLSNGALGVTAVMWVPGLVGLLSLGLFRFPFKKSLGLSPAKPQWLAWAIALPLVWGTLAYAGAWGLGACTFGWGHAFSLSALVLSLFRGVLNVTGEELGWRGFLFPTLRKVVSFRTASLVSGLIWAAWHYPAIVLGNYNNGGHVWFALVAFTFMVLGSTFAYSWLRERSGSILPCILIHVVHNWYIQRILDPLVVPNAVTKYATSEFGAGLAITCLVCGVVFWKWNPSAVQSGHS